MYTSPYLVSRGAEEARRNLQADIARQRFAAQAAGPRQRALGDVLTVVTTALRVLQQRLAPHPVGTLQQAP